MREAPLILVDVAHWLPVEAAIAQLPEEKKSAFMALHAVCMCKKTPCEENDVMQRWDNNSFEINFQDNELGNILVFIWRLNHSCLPNAGRGFTKDLSITFRALVSLPPF